MWYVDGPFGVFYFDHLMTLKVFKKNTSFYNMVYAKDVLHSKLSSMLRFIKIPSYQCPVINC